MFALTCCSTRVLIRVLIRVSCPSDEPWALLHQLQYVLHCLVLQRVCWFVPVSNWTSMALLHKLEFVLHWLCFATRILIRYHFSSDEPWTLLHKLQYVLHWLVLQRVLAFALQRVYCFVPVFHWPSCIFINFNIVCIDLCLQHVFWCVCIFFPLDERVDNRCFVSVFPFDELAISLSTLIISHRLVLATLEEINDSHPSFNWTSTCSSASIMSHWCVSASCRQMLTRVGVSIGRAAGISSSTSAKRATSCMRASRMVCMKKQSAQQTNNRTQDNNNNSTNNNEANTQNKTDTQHNTQQQQHRQYTTTHTIQTTTNTTTTQNKTHVNIN